VIGRVLRALTGVDEKTLDLVPSERARYTAMGGVVLGTALIAMFSMGVALLCVFDGFNPAIPIFVPVWGAFILCLDRWMMASGAARHLTERLLKLLPRLVLSIVFGVIIAEPLLLGIFHSAIEKRIADDRIKSVATYEADLKQCNPLPEAEPDPRRPDPNAAKCGELHFSVPTDVPARTSELNEVTTNRDTLKTQYDADVTKWQELEALARDECTGNKGRGLTGQRGQGPNCKRLRQQADKYRDDHKLSENQTRLDTRNDKVKSVTDELAQARTAESSAITAKIAELVTDYRSNQKEKGLLERLAALGHLVDEDGNVHTAQWALRLFFIGVDSLPVLLKFLSGFTPYDKVVSDRVVAQKRGQTVASETERRRLVIQEELARHQMNAEHLSAVNKVDFDARVRHVDVELLHEEMTDSRAAYLLHDSPTRPIAMPPREHSDDGSR